MLESSRVLVLFLARLRESMGCAQWEGPLAADVTTVGALIEQLTAGPLPAAAKVLGAANIQVAVNQELAQTSTAIQGGDEIAFFPPVTGG